MKSPHKFGDVLRYEPPSWMYRAGMYATTLGLVISNLNSPRQRTRVFIMFGDRAGTIQDVDNMSWRPI